MAREQVKTHDIPADKLQGLTRAVMTTSKGDITIDLFPKEGAEHRRQFLHAGFRRLL